MLDFSVTFIITIINITILFFILRAALFKPVTKFMTQRAKRVQDSIDAAEKNKAEAKALLSECEEKLKLAEEKAKSILISAREEAARQAEYIISEGKAEVESIAVAGREQLKTEYQAALVKFRMEAAALVLAASSKLAAKELSPESAHYVNMLLEELSARKENN